MKPAYVNILLDETGSMAGQEARVIKGINEYIAKLSSDLKGKACRIAIRLFDSERWREYFDGKLEDFPTMKDGDYRPGAMTPLYDAIGKTLMETETKTEKHKVLILIDTDGLENASREHTKESVDKLIKEKEAAGWTFVFLGADLDAFGGAAVAAASMGVHVSNTAGYAAKSRVGAYHAVASASSDWAEDTLTDAHTDKRFMSRTSHKAFSEVDGKRQTTSRHGNGRRKAEALGVDPATVSRWGEDPPQHVKAYDDEKRRADAASNKLRNTLNKLEGFTQDD